MPLTCECGMPLDDPRRRSACHGCGSRCCRSGRIDVDGRASCNWCAIAFIAV